MDSQSLPETPVIFPPPRSIRIGVGFRPRPPALKVRFAGLPVISNQIITHHLQAIGAFCQESSGTAADIDVHVDARRLPAQAYRLVVDPGRIHVTAGDEAAVAYALGTLAQILAQFPTHLPLLEIDDQPDLPRRGFYLDISRGKVPNLEKLLSLIHRLAEWRYNELQLYIENVFEFPGHDFYADTTPLNADEIRRLDAECRRYGIDFIPSLTSLGHFDKILRHPLYRPLAEIEPADLPAAGVTPWCDAPWTLCVSDPAAADLIRNLYDAFLPNFSSSFFNICCDESWDLALGRSREYAKQIGGVGEAYVRWINHCAQLAARHGKKIEIWGDIIINHPDKIASLPADTTLLEWGYEADHPFDEHAQLLAQSGRSWYVCPGTSSWQSFGGRLNVAMANIRNAAAAGRRHRAAGMLLTDWGDYGHQQCFAVSLIPIITGAALAWNTDTPDGAIYNFAQRTAGARVAVDHLKLLGHMHDRIALERPRNSSLEFRLFREPPTETKFLSLLNVAEARSVLSQIDAAIASLPGDDPQLRNDHLADGLLISLAMSQIALRHGLHRLGAGDPSESAAQHPQIKKIAELYHIHWHRWNKPSRWVDIQHWFDRLAEQYR